MARSEAQVASGGSKGRSKSAAAKPSRVSTMPMTAAIAWGMLPGPAFKDERHFRNLVNKELRRNGLWLANERFRDSGGSQHRLWRLMRTGRSRALLAEGKLQHCCMEALKIITPGGNDDDV